MSPNQRLITAVVLSFVFFVAYTAIFPPEVQENLESNTTQQEQVSLNKSTTTQTTSSNIDHEISSDEQMVTTTSNTLLTVTTDDYILKVDTLGRIASKVMLADKFNNTDDKHAELVSSSGAKPLYIRFADKKVNDEAMATGYKTSLTDMHLKEGESQEVTLVQNLSNLRVEKKITFYADGHYDLDVALSEPQRYYLYLGKRPQINKQLMTVVGSMIYSGKDLTTIFEDGDVEGRSTFNDVHLATAFGRYYA